MIISNIASIIAFILSKRVEEERNYKRTFITSSIISFLFLFPALTFPSLLTYLIAILMSSLGGNLASLSLTLALIDSSEELLFELRLRNLIAGLGSSITSMLAWSLASNLPLLIIISVLVTLSGIFFESSIFNVRQLNIFLKNLKTIDNVTLYLVSSNDPELTMGKLREVNNSVKLLTTLLLSDRMLFGIASGIFFSIVPSYLLERSNSEMVYLALGFNSLSSSLGYLIARWTSINVALYAIIIRITSMLTILFIDPNFAVLPLIMMGVCWSIYDTITSYIASNNLPSGILSLYLGIINLGSIIGAFLGGYLIQNVSTGIPIACTFLLFSGLVLTKIKLP
jgi:predicted MFS family arabinose efflux permease